MSYEVIQRVEVGVSGAASVELNNIPADYTDLIIKLSARSDDTTRSGGDVLLYRLNNATSGYALRELYGNGIFATGAGYTTLSSSDAGGDWGRIGANINNDNHGAGIFANVEMVITNYTSSADKAFSFNGTTPRNAASFQGHHSNASYTTSTSAITSVSFALFAGSFKQFTTVSLFGRLAGSDGTTTVS
jgi:hypothetical protein